MKIVIDTNAVISGTFFGGFPGRVIEAVVENKIKACASLEIVEPTTDIQVSRDPDDDKFIECAIDAKALYIVSGDKDLLDIGAYEGIKIITAAEFCDKYIEHRNQRI